MIGWKKCQRFSANQRFNKTIANFAALNAGCLYLVCVIIFLFVFDLLKCILLFVFLPNLVWHSTWTSLFYVYTFSQELQQTFFKEMMSLFQDMVEKQTEKLSDDAGKVKTILNTHLKWSGQRWTQNKEKNLPKVWFLVDFPKQSIWLALEFAPIC